MKAASLADLLQRLYREKHALVARHVAGAEAVSGYEFNNAYQNVIDREGAQLSWVRMALQEIGAEVPEDVASLPVPHEGKGGAAQRAVIADDARRLREFHEAWKPWVDSVTNARHKKMLGVILGETLEHLRFFDQMLEGRDDVLGRRHANVGTGGGVLSARWRE